MGGGGVIFFCTLGGVTNKGEVLIGGFTLETDTNTGRFVNALLIFK